MPSDPVMPCREDAEKAVLSWLFTEPWRLDEPNGLTAEHFHLPAHHRFFELVQAKHAAGVHLDEVTLGLELHLTGAIEAFGGISGFTEIATYTASRLGFPDHCRILREMLARRRAMRAGYRLMEAAGELGSEDYLHAAGAPITAIHEAATASRPAPDARSLARDFHARFEAMARGEVTPIGIETGIPEIDGPLRGLHRGMFGVVSARSGGGKSTLATQMMCGLATEDTPAVYIPLEGTPDAAFTRCVIQLSRLPAAAVTDPLGHARRTCKKEAVSAAGVEAVKQASLTLQNGAFHFDPPANRRLDTVLASIRRARRKHGIAVAFVDYLQLVYGEPGRSKEEEIAGVSHRLQELAAELGIVIIAMSQENDNGETKHARAVEEDADWWLSIVQHRDRAKANFQQHRHVLLVKDRHWGNGGTRLPLLLDRERVRFVHGLEEKPVAKGAPVGF